LVEKSTEASGLRSHSAKIRRPVFHIVLLGLLLNVFSWGERTACAQSGKVPPGTEPERISPEPTEGIGAKEVPREDGGKDKIYYSIITPEEERKAKQEEKEKEERSWDILKNIIIDNHRR
jgi:hypothetical protein